MASNQTSNYGLNQWQSQDKVLREEFNQDNAKLDAALGGLAEALETKASSGELSALDSQLKSQISSVEGRLLRAAAGTYTGTGSSGSSAAKTLNFSTSLGRAPMLVVVRPEAGEGDGLVLLQGMTKSMPSLSGGFGSSLYNTVSWSGSRVSWYAETAQGQMNKTGVVYHYFAIG